MMIHVIQIDELTFNVQFDPALTETLIQASGWTTTERVLYSILSDALLGPSFTPDDLDDLDYDVPF